MNRRGQIVARPLRWQPSTLSNPTVVELGQSNLADRIINLGDNEDCLIRIVEPIDNSDISYIGSNDAIVTVNGGRNIQVIGGSITVLPTPTTILTASIDDVSTAVLNVDSTAGFGSTGFLRIDGEGILYSGKTATSFTGLTRQYGYQNSGEGSSFVHQSGAKVYAGEMSRSALGFVQPWGNIHIEGLLIDGAPNDGIRFEPHSGVMATIQNTRIEGITGDNLAGLDGHPDCVQVWNGPMTLRMDRVSLFPGKNGTGINDTDTRTGIGPVGVSTGILRDVEVIGSSAHKALFADAKLDTVWDVQNCWAYRTRWGFGPTGDTNRPSGFQTLDAPPFDENLFVPGFLAGMRYLSPGYYV